MKTIFAAAIIIFILSACNKNDNVEPKQFYSDKVVLQPLQISDDAVLLTWSEIHNPAFSHYYVIRRTDSTQVSGEVIATIENYKTTNFTDRNLSFSPFASYQVAAVMKSGNSFSSNVESFSRPKLKLTLNPVVFRNDSIILDWSKIEHRSIFKYSITKFVDGTPQLMLANVAADKTSAADASFYYNTQLGYQVTAHSSTGATIESNIETIATPAPKLTLKELQIFPDSVKLEWSGLNKYASGNFNIVRKLSSNDPGTVIATLNNSNRAFTDKNIPYSGFVGYEVSSGVYGTGMVTSNQQVLSRPEIITLPVAAFDILFDRQSKWLYLFGKTGKIVAYDNKAKQIVGTINSLANLGYGALGDHDGIRELYVPRNDGYIFIYNAGTLEKIDQINVGESISSVAFQNGKIFVALKNTNVNGYRSYDRTTKKLISQANGDQYDVLLRILPNSNSTLLAVSMSVSPIDADLWKFDATGNFVEHQNDPYHGIYPLDPYLLQIFPAGNKYVTASEGAIYSNEMIFEGYLPRGNKVIRTYSIDESRNEILTGTSFKTIDAYSISGYNLAKSYITKNYPYRLFSDNNDIICVGVTDISYFGKNIPPFVILEIFTK